MLDDMIGFCMKEGRVEGVSLGMSSFCLGESWVVRERFATFVYISIIQQSKKYRELCI